MGGETDTVVSNTSLREVVGTYLGRAVAGRDKSLAVVGNVVDIFLMLAVVDEGAQT